MATKKNTGAKPVGRPSKFNQTLADDICERIANGDSLRSICGDEKYPAARTVHRWMSEDEEFCQQYASACEERAAGIFDEMLEISDTPLIGEKRKVTDKGEEVSIGDNVERARLMLDARKWVLSRMSPKKYGDRVQQEVSGSIGAEVTLIERVIVDPKKNEDNDTHTTMD